MDPKRTKLGPRGIKCAFIGYLQNSKVYRLLNLESNVIVESQDVEFFENLITKDKESESPKTKNLVKKILLGVSRYNPKAPLRLLKHNPSLG